MGKKKEPKLLIKKYTGPTETEEFEFNNQFHYKNHYQQTICYLNHMLSRLIAPIDNQKDLEDQIYDMKRVFNDPMNRMKVVNFNKYIKKTIEEFDKTQDKYYDIVPKSIAYGIIYFCNVFALFGFRQDQIPKLFSKNALSPVASKAIDRFVEIDGCLEWFKQTLEYKEWEAKEKWLQEHPSYYRAPDDNNTETTKERDRKMAILKGLSKSPRHKLNNLNRRLSSGK